MREPSTNQVGEILGERSQDRGTPVRGLIEVGRLESSTLQHVEDLAVDDRTDRLDNVEREAVPVLDVGVQDAEPGIEPDRNERDPAFRFGERVAVVEDRVHR